MTFQALKNKPDGIRHDWLVSLLLGTLMFPQIVLAKGLNLSKLGTCIAFTCWISSTLVRRRDILRVHSRLDAEVLVFILATLLSILLLTKHHILGEILVYLQCGWIYFFLKDEVRSWKGQIKLAWFLVVPAALSCLINIYRFNIGANRFVEGINRLNSPLDAGINVMSAEVLGILGVCVMLIWVERRPFQRLILAVCNAIFILTLGLSYSRGAWIGLLVAMICSLMLFRTRKGLQNKILPIASCLVLLLIVNSGILPSVTKRIETIENFKENDHWYIYKVAVLETIPARPIFGWGRGNLEDIWPEMAAATPGVPGWMAEGLPRDAHSTFLNIAAKNGVPMLLLFVGIIAETLQILRKKWRLCPPGSREEAFFKLNFAVLIGFFAASFFVPMENFPFIYVMLAMPTALSSTSKVRSSRAVIWRIKTNEAPRNLLDCRHS